ncbi:ATP-binding protein [Lacipirellula sp.]|uniref:ATP-binding protein n=1 Tax=Lacipirellula sp. TaxID=2691419 RepID=UPI003D13027B
MQPLRRYSLVEWSALVVAALAMSLGATMIIAWLAGYADLLRLANPGPTLRFNTAVIFALSGAALFCSVTHRRQAATWLAGAALAFSGLHFVEVASGASIGMESVLHEPSEALIKRVGDGRMALGVSLCFMLLSVAILVRNFPRFDVAVASLAGIVVCMLALVALSRYVMGTDLRVGWQLTTGMALPTAVGLFLLGGVVVAMAYREAAADGSSWLAYPASFALAAASVLVWRELVDNETLQLRRATAVAAAGLRLQVREQLQLRLQAVDRFADRWGVLDRPQQRKDARRLLEDFGGILAINWINPELRIAWVCSAGEREDVFGKVLPPGPRHDAVVRSRETGQFAFTPVLALIHGESGFIGYLPTVGKSGDVTGYIAAVFRIDTILGGLADDRRHDAYSFSVEEGGRTIFASADEATADSTVAESTMLKLRGLDWRFKVWPTPETVALHYSKTPDLALAKGLLSALLLAAAINMRQRASRQTAEAERAAAALRDSEQRFDLAVGASQDGIWEWRTDQAGFYASARYREIFGFPPGDEKLSVEEWFTRVHSSDVAEVRAAIDAHCQDRAPYDVTVRYLTLHNRWIWVRIRGQAAWDATGRPYRMAGSASDITEERESKKQLLAHVEAIAGSNRALAEMAEAAQAAAMAKATFLRNMSHELRTPLNSIIGFSTGLLRHVGVHGLDDHQRNRIERIAASGRHLLALVNNVLDLAKAEAREQALMMEPVDVAELFDELIAMTEPLLQKRPGVEFTVVVPDDLGTPLLDRTKLKQVLLNLLANAVKFTDAGTITLAARSDEENWIFAVSDTGIGIPSQDQSRIFENFEQVHSAGRHAEGTGLGLAICATFASAMQGEITLESQAGAGSTFALVVPRTIELEEEPEPPALQPTLSAEQAAADA